MAIFAGCGCAACRSRAWLATELTVTDGHRLYYRQAWRLLAFDNYLRAANAALSGTAAALTVRMRLWFYITGLPPNCRILGSSLFDVGCALPDATKQQLLATVD